MMKRRMTKILSVLGLFLLPWLAVMALEGDRTVTGESASWSTIRVGVYNGDGASPTCVIETLEALRIDSGIIPSLIGPTEIYTGGLSELDVIVFPGGSGSRQNNSLGSGSHERIRDFVLVEGKGIVGICAGAYLVSDSEGYPCLRLIGAGTIDREHDERGSAVCEIIFSQEGLEIFPEMKDYEYGYIQYHDGPVFVPPSDGSLRYSILAVNRSDVHHTGDAPAGMTPGKAFLLCEEAGKGRVFACAGHPESTVGMRWMVPRMARWAARRELVSFGDEVTRPGLGTDEIMHSDELETELFWKLFGDDPGVKIAAFEELREKRYRSGFRWAVGLLRDSSPEVRAFAAKVLADSEYTAAIPDLEAVISIEKDEACKARLQSALNYLKGIVASSGAFRQ